MNHAASDTRPPENTRPENRARRWARMGLTLAIAAAGGTIAALAGLPLPWLIGAQLALCIVALADVRILGGPPTWPAFSRTLFLPALGVMIGTSFTPEVTREIPSWWPSLIVVSCFLLLAHLFVYLLFRRVGRYDFKTAFFASFPGGYVEAVLLGAKVGGQERLIVVQHFLRVSLIVLVIPVIFWIFSGHQVGSSSNDLFDAAAPLTMRAAVVLFSAGLVGTVIARFIHLPAADISGAVAASAAVHLAGWVDGAIPQQVIAITQLVIGTSLGVGFVGIGRYEFTHAIALAIAAFCLVFLLTVGVALSFAGMLDTSVSALILALAPGGLAEMSLVALSLQISVPFVTLLHLYRIFFTVMVIPRLYAIAEKRHRASSDT